MILPAREPNLRVFHQEECNELRVLDQLGMGVLQKFILKARASKHFCLMDGRSLETEGTPF